MESMQKGLNILKNKFPRFALIVGVSVTTKNQSLKDQVPDYMELFRKENKKHQEFFFTPDRHVPLGKYSFEKRNQVKEKSYLRQLEKKGLYTSKRKKTSFHIDKKDKNFEYLGVDNFLVSNENFIESICCNWEFENIGKTSSFFKSKKYLPS